MKRVLIAIVAAFAAFAAAAQNAASYPSKPIKIVVPFTAGSTTDIVARLIGEKLSTSWGQPVVIDNKPGAGGTLGAGLVARSEPDGYTLIVVSAGHVVNPVLYSNLPYDTVGDFAGVTALASLPNVLVVSANSPFKTVGDLIAAAKAQPGKLNFASAGRGSATHVNTEKFLHAAGVQAMHIPFKGTPETITETIAGRVDFMFTPLLSSLSVIRDNRMRALAVSTAQRSPALPEVPTVAQAGVPGFAFDFWAGLLAPAKTPRDIVAKLNQEVVKALAQPDVIERLSKLGADPMPMTPERFDAFIREEYTTLGAVMKGAAK